MHDSDLPEIVEILLNARDLPFVCPRFVGWRPPIYDITQGRRSPQAEIKVLHGRPMLDVFEREPLPYRGHDMLAKSPNSAPANQHRKSKQGTRELQTDSAYPIPL
ncbi:hypothetical protein [Bradyrhizobium elkanii]|uniref:hypothetical protein n=1 Tax=Bradyrhizobium elkanii TaxID=29448 RepID=UPI001BAE1A20|nr:hypothetical protein [Bradyrhizobium elkanii]MBR1165239.1 hypothetical protein [Bradyrhizobium elkanii]